jgi:hypothetical protein
MKHYMYTLLVVGIMTSGSSFAEGYDTVSTKELAQKKWQKKVIYRRNRSKRYQIIHGIIVPCIIVAAQKSPTDYRAPIPGLITENSYYEHSEK